MSPNRSLYGAALRLWVRSDAQRIPKIAQILETSELDHVSTTTAVWIPYCLSYLSHYPLFDFMSDYLRCSWMLWSKNPDKFNTQGVQRLTKMPPPKPDQFLRIALEKHTLCYQVPSLSSDFQNFALWPLFTCMSANHIVALLDAALSQKAQIIFTSHHIAVLTTVAESVRFYLGSWAGLYVPVVYGRHAQELVEEPAPYILGIPKQSRTLFNPPRDALLIDLDFNRIFTSRPPGALSPRQRTKYSTTLAQALGSVSVEGVPNHLRSAYEQSTRFSAFGPTLAENSSLTIKEPDWWDHMRVLNAMRNICDRIRRNIKFLSIWRRIGTQSEKVQKEDVATIIHHRNHLSRSLDEAWREHLDVKRRADLRMIAQQKSMSLMDTEIEKGKKDFQDLSECTAELIEETRQLQSVINQRNKDISRINQELKDKTTHARQMSSHAHELQSELHSASKALKGQQEMLTELKSRSSKDILSQERDNSQRAVIHLTSLISGQMAYIERVMASLLTPSRPNSQQDMRKEVSKRMSFQRSGSPQSPISPGPKSRPMASRRNTVDLSNRKQNQISQDPESFEDKIRLISETVRKINNQCFQAIEDLAARREDKTTSDNSSSDDEERFANMRTPDLDSRADTALSGSIAGTVNSEEPYSPAPRIQAIVEEMEGDMDGDDFVDAAPIVEKKEVS